MKKYSYDEAVSYIEEQGVNCDPCSGNGVEGEYVCDMLDDNIDGRDRYDEPYYYKSTLDGIVEDAIKYREEMEEDN